MSGKHWEVVMRSCFHSLVNVKCFIVCFIGLQLLFISIFVYYSNAGTPPNEQHPLFAIDPINHGEESSASSHSVPPLQSYSVDTAKSNINTDRAHHEYIEMVNYRGHLSVDPKVVHFGEINGQTLSGMMIQFGDKDDANLGELQLLCDSLSDCIGFSLHPNLGAILCNGSSFPLQYVRNWRFFIKNDPQNTKYEMNEFVNQRIGHSVELLSSSDIPSLSSLGLAFAVPVIRRQFMSFEWNLGRTNNQLYSLEAMLQYVVIYQRTLILPFASHRNHELAMTPNTSTSVWDMLKLSEFADYIFEYELAALSVPDILDFVVTQNEDIDYDAKTFNIGMSAEDEKWRRYFREMADSPDEIRNEPNWNLLSLLEYRRFTNNDRWTLSHESEIHENWDDGGWSCYVSRGIRDRIPGKSQSRCRLIHFCLGRYAHFKLDDWPIFDVLLFLIPSPRIRSAAEQTISFWFERPELYRIGVHRRAMKEGGSDASGSPYVCRFVSKSLAVSGRYQGLRSAIESVFPEQSQQIATLYDDTCAISMDSIQRILRFHKQPPLLRSVFWDQNEVDYNDRGKRNERWFLGADNQEPEVLKEWIENKGAVTLNGKKLADFWKGPLYWNRAQQLEDEQNGYNVVVEKQYFKYLKLFETEEVLQREHAQWLRIKDDGHKPRWWYEMSKIEFWRKEIVVFDMWMLRKSKFFVGSWHSTLTRNVCHWRGFDAMFNATNCYLHHKWRRTTADSQWFNLSALT